MSCAFLVSLFKSELINIIGISNVKTTTILHTPLLKSIINEEVISTNLRIGIIEFDNMNPILSNNKNVQDLSRLIFEPLFTLTEDYKLKGILADEC